MNIFPLFTGGCMLCLFKSNKNGIINGTKTSQSVFNDVSDMRLETIVCMDQFEFSPVHDEITPPRIDARPKGVTHANQYSRD